MLQLAFLNGKNISLCCLFYESFVLADNPWLWSFADGHGSEYNSGYPTRGLNIPLRAEARQLSHDMLGQQQFNSSSWPSIIDSSKVPGTR